MNEQTRFVDLVKAYLEGSSSEQEQEELRMLIRQMDEEALDLAMKPVWMGYASDIRMPESEAETLLNKILHSETFNSNSVPLRQSKLRILRRVSVAAAIIILLGTGAYLWNKNSATDKGTASAEARSAKADVAPGGERAVLTLSDGSTIILDSAANGTLAQQGNTTVTKQDGQIIYSYPPLAGVSRSDGGGPAVIPYNTMTTPRGGQYQLTLPDGTKVWLNAASSITYPVVFTGKQRNVKITGEAYFEIAPDINRPFTVSHDKMSIQVLGTHFNVNAYDDEENIKVTLLEGSVKVNMPSASKILKPGQQASLSHKSDRSHQIPVQTADVEQVMAWKNGKFYFDAADIQTIMKQVSRWYGVEVEYEGEVKRTFYGTVSRNVSAEVVFKVLEETGGVHFRIEGKKVFVFP